MSEAPLRKPHVAVVDDEEDILFIIEQILEELPLEVHSFINPKEALEYISGDPQKINLLVTDFRMPQMSGLELIQKIRKLNSSMRIIIISAFEPTGREIESAIKELGISTLITKPFTIETMQKWVTRDLFLSRKE